MLPTYIYDNLNSKFEIRDYQKQAIKNFVNYFENEHKTPIHKLFHMATGSGKTLIMASLMLYLYKKGYKNFLFFVHLSNIINKAKDDFLNPKFSKHLFNSPIDICGKRVIFKEVSNFEENSNGNIYFTTIHGLHSSINDPHECEISIDSFENHKVVMISDEAHHLNADTKNKKENEENKSWENTINQILIANKKNILLEFTATCDLKNTEIQKKYKDKIIFDYPLEKFREDKFSKEIHTMQSNLPLIDRMLGATMLSQYRLKLFNDNKINIKPVVMFKSNFKKDLRIHFENFQSKISRLTGKKLEEIAGLNSKFAKMHKYFEDFGFDLLAKEIKNDFGKDFCIIYDGDNKHERKRNLINTLDEKDNQIRGIFAVNMLDEGWDVLNLFDIVRLYETYDFKKNKPDKTTIAEAQLIGRGARYCPFYVFEGQNKFKRKYDNDLENPLRICEEMYYHCQNDSQYIAGLKTALRETGIIAKKSVIREYKLKENFKNCELYKSGLVFTNERKPIGLMKKIAKLKPEYVEIVNSKRVITDMLLCESEIKTFDNEIQYSKNQKTICEFAEENYSLLHKALRKHSFFKFSNLKNEIPWLRSTKEFLKNILGNIKIKIGHPKEIKKNEINYLKILTKVFDKIKGTLFECKNIFKGTREFVGQPIKKFIKDKKVQIEEHGEAGKSQKCPLNRNLQLDLTQENWYAFDDNFGTSEEKAFVKYFKMHINELQEKYEKIYIVRNERQIKIYSFEEGERFEPDFLLFLQRKNNEGNEQFQIFIEAKGAHLAEQDKWKNKFLKQIKAEIEPITFFNDKIYKILGLPFYNSDENSELFREFYEWFEKFKNK
ncbi:MAG: DEAD/DEAH box helicase family protein [Oscillospiraceae bacterium]|jgi:type III restriction enzyme|nr:DEAD/DEAH box helicase family protein [Oscillospiraceae bacterium]